MRITPEETICVNANRNMLSGWRQKQIIMWPLPSKILLKTSATRVDITATQNWIKILHNLSNNIRSILSIEIFLSIELYNVCGKGPVMPVRIHGVLWYLRSELWPVFHVLSPNPLPSFLLPQHISYIDWYGCWQYGAVGSFSLFPVDWRSFKRLITRIWGNNGCSSLFPFVLPGVIADMSKFINGRLQEKSSSFY